MKRSADEELAKDEAAERDRIESFTRGEALQNKAFIVETLPFEVVLLDSGRVLSRLIDLLRREIDEQIARGVAEADTQGFWHNRGLLIDAYKHDELYVLKFSEDDDNANRRGMWALLREAGFIVADSRRLLPCFCAMDDDHKGPLPYEIDMIWTDSAFRRLGLARAFVQHFEVKDVAQILPDSRGFWERCGVKIWSEYEPSSNFPGGRDQGDLFFYADTSNK